MVQYTRKAINEGFIALLNERPFDKISVVDIAEKCGITRNTFYYHYADIYALVDEIFRNDTERLINQNVDCNTWQEAVVQATDFARENRHAIFHLYHSINRDRVEEYLYNIVLISMTSYIQREAEGLADINPEDVHTLAVFYTSALLGLMTKWLHDGMIYDVEAYIADIGRLLEGNILISLKRGQRRPSSDTWG